MFDPANIPHFGTLKRRRLKAGNCLGHCKVLTDVGDPYRLAMGDLQIGGPCLYRHCWLETDEFVVDLNHPDRFFERESYYRRMQPVDVHLYTLREALTRGEQAGWVWDFWDLPPQPPDTPEKWNAWHRAKHGEPVG